MRVAIVTESFLPSVNGVANSVLRVLEHLERRGHHAVVVAPGDGPTTYAGAKVVRVPSVALPRYPSFPIGLPSPRVEGALRAFGPDVVHVASPIALGALGLAAAARLGVPSVAVYQTDVAGFVTQYRLTPASSVVWRWLRRVHRSASLTLAPSSYAVRDLRRRGFGAVARWGRGVDLDRFSPRWRSNIVRHRLLGDAHGVVGYVGRLAHEKQLDRLAALQDLPGCRLVVVGDGPVRRQLERVLPKALFLGFLSGRELSTVLASLDVFVHPGEHETYCQAAQEALASGVPVVAPASGGLPDVVEHGRTGLLWDPSDRTGLRTYVSRLLMDVGLRRRLADSTRRSVEHRTWTSLGDELLSHYASVTSMTSTRATA